MPGWLDQLPHGPEFRFVSRVTALEPGRSGRGLLEVAPDDLRLRGHFPGRPVVPGVHMIEAVAQLGGLVAFAGEEIDGGGGGRDGGGALARVEVRFGRSVEPPAAIELQAEVLRIFGRLAQCRVWAGLDGDTVCEGEVVIAREREHGEERK